MNIPFEYQRWNDPTQRSCAAAALHMVYLSYGLQISQDQIWKDVSIPAPSGGRYSKTFLVVKNALEQKIWAIGFRDRNPVNTTRRLLGLGLRVILNHRVSEDSSFGHYTVAVAHTDKGIVVHDPQEGPNRFISNKEISSLWTPKGDNCEITGRVLIAVSNRAKLRKFCHECNTPIFESVNCKRCSFLIPLQPSATLQCFNVNCIKRTWETFFCPNCDMPQ